MTYSIIIRLIHFYIFVKGATGFPGAAGRVGPPGPAVRITTTLI